MGGQSYGHGSMVLLTVSDTLLLAGNMLCSKLAAAYGVW